MGRSININLSIMKLKKTKRRLSALQVVSEKILVHLFQKKARAKKTKNKKLVSRIQYEIRKIRS